MNRKMTFFALPTRAGKRFAPGGSALLAPNIGCPSMADKATAPKPQPALRRKSRREVTGE